MIFVTVIPSSYSINIIDASSMNGSSATGHCSSIVSNGIISTCIDPTSSVLFDGIPTLTGLDGDMWAKQILTLQSTHRTIDVSFSITGDLERVELVMFNCPQWGIAVRSIRLRDIGGQIIGNIGNLNSITSCDSLVRLCVPATVLNPVVVSVLFDLDTDSNWVHFAEVVFYDDSTTCSPDTSIATETITAPDATTPLHHTTTQEITAATTMTPPPNTSTATERAATSAATSSQATSGMCEWDGILGLCIYILMIMNF